MYGSLTKEGPLWIVYPSPANFASISCQGLPKTHYAVF